jgi:hypothetical protein
VYPYGGDVQTTRFVRDLRVKEALLLDYPAIGKQQHLIENRIQHYAMNADFVYTSVEAPDYLPYWDYLLMQASAIDTTKINPDRMRSGPLRERFPNKVIVVHAPNHRNLKGTHLLEQACTELRREGRVDFELIMLERQPNETVLQAIYDADIVADQFIIGAYAMFALEGMALGKPVMCYIRPDLSTLYRTYSWGKECPLVNTPPDQIKEKLIWLLDHREEWATLGHAGRAFVERYHSLESMGRVYEAFIRKVWFDDAALLETLPWR